MKNGEASAQPPIGGRYRVLSLLGRGGMGAVYQVIDERDGRELALKRLVVPSGHEQTVTELFEREFHALSELSHPRIIEVYDYGVDGEGAYYTMELLKGQDLRELGKTDWRTACALLRDVASSLAVLHSRKLLHCDISPRNVRCTGDGRAKLLDFGAMAPMGVAKRVMGTPPFIAPEMVQVQFLDGRADLYGFGALAYWMLTGRYAYPARTIAELRELWQKPPRPVIDLEPETPSALSELVMDCLRVNRNARPRSAGVVMERLCAIASLPLDEHTDVAQAYLTMPTLVGRGSQLASVRAALLRRERGSVIAVQGRAGSGRSRLLDACVLEAKLLGWQVLRTDAGDAAQGSYGVARELCEQLFFLAPEVAKAAASLHAPVLAHVLGPELVQSAPQAEPPPRDHVLLSLRDFILSVARSLRVLIAIDDADRLDEASTNLLVALGQKARRRSLCLLFAIDTESAGSSALDLLLQTAERVDLPPLTEQETEELVRSLFGSANHTLILGRRLHAIAGGSPGALMQLAQHLVEQGIARYQAGSFVLPEHLREQDLPRSLVAALERRMASLEPDALELGRTLALTEPSELPASSYATLTSHADRARTYRALDQLVRAQVLEIEGDRYRMSNATWREVLCRGLEADARVELHARLARVFEPAGSVARRAYHLMESAQLQAAIRTLLAQYLKDPNEPRDPLEDNVPGMLELLERACSVAETLRLPAPLRVELQMKTAGASVFVGDLARFLRVAPPLLAQLERESGLTQYESLDQSMEPAARLTAALTHAQQRYEATPELDRGLPPADAIRELARLCAMYGGMAGVAQDLDLLDQTPPLAPLTPLSPAIAAIQRFVDALRALLQGRLMRSLALSEKLLEFLDRPDRAGLGELYHRSLRLGALHMAALIEAGAGIPDVGKRLAELEKVPGYRVNAHRTRLVCQLMQGNLDEAALAQRRAELAMLQDGQQQRNPGTTARVELIAHALMDDLDGVKEVTERLEKTARTLPQWAALAQVGRCHQRRLQGDFVGAFAALQPALGIAPLKYRDWTAIAAAHVQLLVELGRAEEGVERGLDYLATCEQEQLHPGSRFVALATAQALLAAERTAEAVVVLDRAIAEVKRSGGRGLVLGVPYELRARAALAQGDRAAFLELAELCANEYRPDRSSALSAKYERLLQEAAAVWGGATPEVLQAEVKPNEIAHTSAALSSMVRSRVLECKDASERARCVLGALVEAMHSEQAYLYGMREGRVVFLCAVPDVSPPAGLHRMVEEQIQQELDSAGRTVAVRSGQIAGNLPDAAELRTETEVAQRSAAMRGSPVGDDAHGSVYPLLLCSKREGQTVIAAVAAARFSSARRTMPDAGLLESLAELLLEHDDIDAVTCLA